MTHNITDNITGRFDTVSPLHGTELQDSLNDMYFVQFTIIKDLKYKRFENICYTQTEKETQTRTKKSKTSNGLFKNKCIGENCRTCYSDIIRYQYTLYDHNRSPCSDRRFVADRLDKTNFRFSAYSHSLDERSMD